MKTVFMGTPDFSVEIVKALVSNGFEVAAVVTQPDKEAGRGKQIVFSPVKKWALENGIEVIQPQSAKSGEFEEKLKSIAPELIITAAFGQIIPRQVLEIPKYGCINVHASLLPKYRGASPIQQAILEGESVTGVTLMYMNDKMDEGDMILQKSIDIAPDDNAGTLFDKLALLGSNMISELAELLKSGKPKGEPQNSEYATYCRKISKEQGNIDWSQNGSSILNLIRAMTPSPGAFSFLRGKRIKIISAYFVHEPHNLEYGKIFRRGEFISAACADGFINIEKLQPEGKKKQIAKDFLNGFKLSENDAFERKLND